MVWDGMLQQSMVWNSIAKCGIVWYGKVEPGMVCWDHQPGGGWLYRPWHANTCPRSPGAHYYSTAGLGWDGVQDTIIVL